MFSTARVFSDASRIALICAVAGGLSGCYSMGGSNANPAPTPPTPAKFTPFSGTLNSQGVVTTMVSNVYTNATTMTVETKETATIVQTQVQALNDQSGNQRVDTSAGTYGWFGTNDGKLETNGAAVRGNSILSSDTWAIYTNTPGSRLDTSLGAPSLEHSYVGLGSLGKRAVGSAGAMRSHTFAFFGGKSTTDMPTSGKADYKGGFEGVEQSVATGSAPQTSSISGKANLSADFGAKTVRGRVDDVNNHTSGPIKTPSGYSIAFDGKITQSGFAGNAWLTQKNSDAPLSGFVENSGTLQGGFFGAGAAEAAGALGVSAADANKKLLVTGAFGAKKQ